MTGSPVFGSGIEGELLAATNDTPYGILNLTAAEKGLWTPTATKTSLSDFVRSRTVFFRLSRVGGKAGMAEEHFR